MVRSIRVLGPTAALLAVFTACGGTTDSGLFSGSGGSSAAGASSQAGAGTTPEAGSSSVAGSVNAGGDEAIGGDSSAGGSTGGAAAGGATSGGASSQAGSGEQGGSAGHAEGGSAGHAEGGGAGHPAGGTSAGGSAGAGSGGKGSAGAGGGSTTPTCADLLAQAATELEAARACNLAQNVQQCTGKVDTTCGCQVPVERSDSAATNAYEATLKQIQAKHCVQVCPAIACVQVRSAQCRATAAGSTKGMCVASFPVPVGN